MAGDAAGTVDSGGDIANLVGYAEFGLCGSVWASARIPVAAKRIAIAVAFFNSIISPSFHVGAVLNFLGPKCLNTAYTKQVFPIRDARFPEMPMHWRDVR
jgi:hypothetical protein